jgi:hypothetical protein
MILLDCSLLDRLSTLAFPTQKHLTQKGLIVNKLSYIKKHARPWSGSMLPHILKTRHLIFLISAEVVTTSVDV